MDNVLYNIEMASGDMVTVINGYPMPHQTCTRMIETLGGDTPTRKFEIVEA